MCLPFQRKLHPFTWPNGIFQDQGTIKVGGKEGYAIPIIFKYARPSIQNTFKVTTTRYGPAASTEDYLKKHSKPEILSSNSLGEIKLLPLTQSSLILQPLLMDPQWPNFSVAATPWSAMYMASRAPSNSSTPWLIISGIGEPCTALSVMEAPMKSPRSSLTSSDHSLLLIASLKPIISTKTRLRINGELPRDGSTRS